MKNLKIKLRDGTKIEASLDNHTIDYLNNLSDENGTHIIFTTEHMEISIPMIEITEFVIGDYHRKIFIPIDNEERKRENDDK